MSKSRGLQNRTNTLVTTTPLIIIVLAVGMIVVSTNGITDKLVFAEGALKKFTADLSGKSEVPAVDTKATGTAQFQISADGKQIDYELNVKDLNNFMMAHIHQGKSGGNGPHIVMLSMGKGRITSGDLQGPLSGEQLPTWPSLCRIEIHMLMFIPSRIRMEKSVDR